MSEVLFTGEVDGAQVEFRATADDAEPVKRVFARIMRFTADSHETAPETRAAIADAETAGVTRGRSEGLAEVTDAFVALLSDLAASDRDALMALVGVTVSTDPRVAEKCGIVARDEAPDGMVNLSVLGVVNAALRRAGAPVIAVDIVKEKPIGIVRPVVRRSRG